MKQFNGVYRNRCIEYIIYDDSYKINLENCFVECDSESTPFKDTDIESACQMHIDMICDELDEQERKQAELSKPPTQEEILAEVLLGQAEIIANQAAQDEVLAEMLLNSLEV